MRFIERLKEYAGKIRDFLQIKSQSLVSLAKELLQKYRKREASEVVYADIQSTVDTVKDKTPEASAEKRKILVSYCLYGEKTVRYDGRQVFLENEIFRKWKEEGRLVPACPEVDGGLQVPRLPSERSGMKVISLDGRDVTREFRQGAIHALHLARQHKIAFAVMKEGSPSCGTSTIHDGRFMGEKIHGEGITVELLRNAGIVVFSENELEEAADYLTELESGELSVEKTESSITRRSGIMRGTMK